MPAPPKQIFSEHILKSADRPRQARAEHSRSAGEAVIRTLSDVLAGKIAAGEVVQRPASVVKELMENAVDAGASSIQVVIKKAGSALIQVVDDGCGMGPKDATACFGRHATSKLRSMDDLEHLATLGFRGEALASVSAVAQVELKTRRVQDDAGSMVKMAGGELVEQRPCATPAGTSVAVRNLFYNVPARRNFLKAPSTEFKHIVETFQALALANPTVAFALVHDEMDVYRLHAPEAGVPFDDALLQRVHALFAGRSPDGLVRVEEATSYLSIRGFVGTPETARKSRGDQFLFVNGRPVKSRSLNHAVISSFGQLIPQGAYPFFALFLTLDPGHVDVNVHPQKAEVKFDDERGVYGFIKAVVKRGLATAGLALAVDPTLSPSITVPADGGEVVETAFHSSSRPTSPATWSFVAPDGNGGGRPPGPEILGSETLDPRTFDITSFPSVTISPEGNLRLPSRVEPQVDGADADPEFQGSSRPIWQLHERYLLTPIRFGLMVLDQQAAHERILYEQAVTAMDGGMAASQQLLFPRTIDFDPAEFALVEELMPDLQMLGFDLELFSGRSVLVRGVPSDVHLGSEHVILEEILDEYGSNLDGLQLEARENLARSMARRSAIRPGRILKPEEARALIDQLFACRMPYADPIGRPTMIKMSMEELAKRFGRNPSS